MTLKTRRPTGVVPWPLILIEGPEKAGKTYTSALLARSDKVGQMYWVDLGEGAADEYGAIPGVDYLIAEHDGTFGSIYQAVEDVRAEAQKAADAGARPVVLLLDGMNAEWDLLKDWAAARARSSRFNKAKLEKDPNAEIDISQNYWNDTNARHHQLMRLLMTFPGIVVMTSRGKDIAAVDGNGRPIEGKKDYRVEGQKNLGFDSSCWIRLYRDKPAIIVGARSVHLGIRAGKDEPRRLDRDWTLESVIFDVLKCDPVAAHVRDYVELVPDLTPEQVRDEALKPVTDFKRIKELYAYTNDNFPGVTLISETGDEELLLHILKRAGDERLIADGKRSPQTRQPEAASRQAAQGGTPDDELPSELTWASEFVARLAETSTETGFRQRRSEVELAKARQILTPETAGELLGDIAKREQAESSQPVPA